MAGGMHEPDGIVGGHGIEIGGGDIASFSELALIPARASDPFAGLDQRDLGLYSRHDFRYRSGIRKLDRKSTRLNSSHGYISYAVFCLKKETAGMPRPISYAVFCLKKKKHTMRR